MTFLRTGNKIKKTFFISFYLSAMVGITKAQVFTDDAKINAGYLKSVDSLLSAGNTITAVDAQNALSSRKDPIFINLAKAPRKVLKANAIYEKAKEATVITGIAYLCPRCKNVHLSSSSGYVIDPGGIVVTNFHVASTYANMKDGNKPLGFMVRLFNGRTYPVKTILAASRKDDLAILQVETNGDVLQALALAKSANIGDNVFVLGHPKEMHYFFSQGNVTNKYLEEAGEQQDKFFREMMSISADYATGSSGGPVLDVYGNVVGTVSNTRPLLHSEMNPGLQMIIKNTVPVESLWKLVRKNSR